MKRCVLLVVLAACGDDGGTPDARPDVAGPRCDPTAPFEAPVPLPGLNSGVDDGTARLTPDELSIVFSRRTGAGSGIYDLYIARRQTSDGIFETPQLIATANSVNSEYWPTISPDGLLLVFDSDRGTATNHIYTSTRATVSDPFGPPAKTPALMDNESLPYLANEHALYFNSATRMGGPGMRDIWRAEIDATGAISSPTIVIGGVNTADDEAGATLTPDELHIFFRRTVAAENDIYTASRSTISDGFGAAVPVPSVATAGLNEIPNWISPDGCVLYLQIVNAPGGMGGDDLFTARRGGP